MPQHSRRFQHELIIDARDLLALIEHNPSVARLLRVDEQIGIKYDEQFVHCKTLGQLRRIAIDADAHNLKLLLVSKPLPPFAVIEGGK